MRLDNSFFTIELRWKRKEEREQEALEAAVMASELPVHPVGNDEEPARITGTRYLSSKAWHK